MTRDPFDRLDTLRARRWGDDAHQRKLEETLMLEYARRKLVTLTRTKAIVVALVLVALGGLAGAGTATYFHNLSVEETPLPDGRTKVRIHEDGKTVFEGVLEEDEALFAIEGCDGEDETIVQVRPADKEDPK
jgi:hypothetical protein